jgi:hypothetical protein
VTDDMVSWTRQQIEARKKLAETVRVGTGEWRYGHVGFARSGLRTYALGLGNRVIDVGADESLVTSDEAQHIAFNDPRQIIADCEADLATLRLHDDLHDCVTETSSQVFPAGDHDEIPCPTLQWLAYRYRFQPGYLPEWAPEGATP